MLRTLAERVRTMYSGIYRVLGAVLLRYHLVRYKCQKDNVMYWLTTFVPYPVRYWIVIRAWADATSGEYGHQEVHSVNMKDVLDRMK